MSRKKELIKQVKRLGKQQISMTKIGKLLGLDPRTVKKYKQIKNPMHGGRGYRPSLIDPFVEELQRLVREGYINKGIDAHLRKLGFIGKYSTVRIRIEDFRRLLKMGVAVKSLPSKKNDSKIKKLFFRDGTSIGIEDRTLLEKLFIKLPETKSLYEFYQDFLKHFSKQQIQGLRKVIIEGLQHPIEEIQNYSRRLYQDIEAIENSLRYSFGNGLLKGQVNRLKTIKRMMYGRASVALLRTRVLFKLN